MARQEEMALFIILLATGHQNWHLQLYEEVRHNFCHLPQNLVQGRSKSELSLASCSCAARRRVRHGGGEDAARRRMRPVAALRLGPGGWLVLAKGTFPRRWR